MKKTFNVEHITVNVYYDKSTKEKPVEEPVEDSEKMELLVETLRIIALDDYFNNKSVLIPEKSKKYGFAKGYHKLPTLLYFLADMLEE